MIWVKLSPYDKSFRKSLWNGWFRDSLENFQTIELDDSNVEGYLGESNVKFTEGLCSAPMMNAKPYELILLRLDENADVEAVKAQIKENANPAKWVCVEAEEVVVENIDNTVLFLMANESEATPIKEAFMNLAQSKYI